MRTSVSAVKLPAGALYTIAVVAFAGVASLVGPWPISTTLGCVVTAGPEGGPSAEPPDAAPAQPGPQPSTVVPSDATRVANLPSLQFAFVGDVIFGRYRDTGYDPIPEGQFGPFAAMAPALEADVVVGNLETPLVRELPRVSPIGARYRFGASVELAEHLHHGGFTVVSLANNHWFDQRWAGVEQTPEILDELGIVGVGSIRTDAPTFRIATVNVKGWAIAFIAITTRSNAPVPNHGRAPPFVATERIIATVGPLVHAARRDHDFVVTLVHWGDEYADAPSSAQVRAAHGLIDAGSDLVIGHHPHVLQAIERYGDGLIAYSLGNFLFENTAAIPRLTGVLRLSVTPADRCIRDVLFHPAYIRRDPFPHPAPALGRIGRQVRARVVRQGKAFNMTWSERDSALALQASSCSAASR